MVTIATNVIISSGLLQQRAYPYNVLYDVNEDDDDDSYDDSYDDDCSSNANDVNSNHHHPTTRPLLPEAVGTTTTLAAEYVMQYHMNLDPADEALHYMIGTHATHTNDYNETQNQTHTQNQNQYNDEQQQQGRCTADAYWLYQKIGTSHFGAVYKARALRRCELMDAHTHERIQWMLPPNNCNNNNTKPLAIKAMDWNKVRHHRSVGSGEDALHEVDALYYLSLFAAIPIPKHIQHSSFINNNKCSSSSNDDNEYNNGSSSNEYTMSAAHHDIHRTVHQRELLYNAHRMYSVMQYCNGRELFDLIQAQAQAQTQHQIIHNNNNNNCRTRHCCSPFFSEHRARTIMRQLLECLAYLHEVVGVAHRDVKAENLVFHDILTKEDQDVDDMFVASMDVDGDTNTDDTRKNNNGEQQQEEILKIIDFGACQRLPYKKIISSTNNNYEEKNESSTRKELHQPFTTLSGTMRYMAPEMRARKDTILGSALDMWSAGVVIYELLVGNPPLEEAVRSNPRFDAVVRGKLVDLIRWDMNSSLEDYNNDSNYSGLSAEAVDLIQGLLCVDPIARLSVRQALNHPWFQFQQEEEEPMVIDDLVEEEEGVDVVHDAILLEMAIFEKEMDVPLGGGYDDDDGCYPANVIPGGGDA